MVYSLALPKLGNKRGISVIVGYALLVGMGIALSVLVFQWLRYYVDSTGDEELTCPEGVNVIITEANCTGTIAGNLEITLKNKGRHNVDGFVIRVNDRPGADQGFYTFDSVGENLSVGETFHEVYPFTSFKSASIIDITFVEVQAYRVVEEKKVYCSFIDTREMGCV